jgi:hypothetical protein
MKSPEIRFPVLAISPEDSFLIVQSLEELSRATPRGLAVSYPNLHLFDSRGCLWAVIGATPERPLSVIDRLLNRQVAVTITLGAAQAEGLSLVIPWLIALVSSASDDLYDQFIPVPDTVAALRRCSTTEDLFRTLDACLNGHPRAGA